MDRCTTIPVNIVAATLVAATSVCLAKPFFDPAVDPSTIRPPPPAPKPLTLAEIAKLTPDEKVQAGRALWNYKCATVAGEKIYRTVPDVEGILLLKLRPPRGDAELGDPNWPGAAFAGEWVADGYVFSFLGYEQPNMNGLTREIRPITATDRGYINAGKTPLARNGYRWVDVIDEKDGKRWRYSGSVKAVGKKDTTAPGVRMELERDPNYDLNIYRWSLDKSPAPDPAPRYGVTFEDHVVPEERALGVASSTIKVLDLQTKEVLGELTRYAVAGTVSKHNPTLWLTAYVCPYGKGRSGDQSRKLADHILIPIDQGK